MGSGSSALCTTSMGLWLPVQAVQGLQAAGCVSGPLCPSHPDAFTQCIRWKQLDLNQFLITSTLIEMVAVAATWSQEELTPVMQRV